MKLEDFRIEVAVLTRQELATLADVYVSSIQRAEEGKGVNRLTQSRILKGTLIIFLLIVVLLCLPSDVLLNSFTTKSPLSSDSKPYIIDGRGALRYVVAASAHRTCHCGRARTCKYSLRGSTADESTSNRSRRFFRRPSRRYVIGTRG